MWWLTVPMVGESEQRQNCAANRSNCEAFDCAGPDGPASLSDCLNCQGSGYGKGGACASENADAFSAFPQPLLLMFS
jgi:hypothetical protein